MGTLSIADVTLETIAAAAREATVRGLNEGAILDFLATIDWTGHDGAPAEVRAILGDLEGWSTNFVEGDLSRAEFVDRLQRLVAVSPR